MTRQTAGSSWATCSSRRDQKAEGKREPAPSAAVRARKKSKQAGSWAA